VGGNEKAVLNERKSVMKFRENKAGSESFSIGEFFAERVEVGDVFRVDNLDSEGGATVTCFAPGSDIVEPKVSAGPLAPFEVRISIGGEDWAYVRRALASMIADIDEYGSLASMMSGGGGGRHSVTVAKREITVEQYREELDAWWRAQKDAARG
jgi:hypothetical protein